MTKRLTLYTYGDSILDSGKYNQLKTNAAMLLARNNDTAFPEFRGQDLTTVVGGSVDIVHHARDGSTTTGLGEQGLTDHPSGPALAIITVGGNDLIRGMTWTVEELGEMFESEYREFLGRIAVKPLLIGNIYDPTFGDDRASFLPDEARNVREKLHHLNSIVSKLAAEFGTLVDLHAHFLKGDKSWFTWNIEPSLKGTSEIRRVLLPAARIALGLN